VVPTELNSVEVLSKAVDEIAEHGISIEMLRMRGEWADWFERAEANAPTCDEGLSDKEFVSGLCKPFLDFNPFCNKHVKRDVATGALKVKKQKICGYFNEVHYQLTDMGLEQALDDYYSTHDYLMVTNADNAYDLSFFKETLVKETDVIACHFLTQKHDMTYRHVKTKFSLSMVDLGAVLIRTSALKRTGLRFLNSIPHDLIGKSTLTSREKSVSLMRSYHDCDWWFVHNAIYALKLQSAIVPLPLFYHQ
jgi:hypothetical protein